MNRPRLGVWQSGSWAVALGFAAIACVAFYKKGYDDGSRETAARLLDQSQLVIQTFRPPPPADDEPTTSPPGTSRPSPAP